MKTNIKNLARIRSDIRSYSAVDHIDIDQISKPSVKLLTYEARRRMLRCKIITIENYIDYSTFGVLKRRRLLKTIRDMEGF